LTRSAFEAAEFRWSVYGSGRTARMRVRRDRAHNLQGRIFANGGVEMAGRVAHHRANDGHVLAADGREVDRVPIPYRGVIAVIALFVVVLVAGGYVLDWRWTGLSRSVTLWDWLQALALPVAVGAAPILLLRRRRMSRSHRWAMVAVLGVFGLLVLTGYLVPMGWTGFVGNTLWDWLELVLLPLVVASASVWLSGAGLRRRHVRLAVPGLVLFIPFAAAGYLVPLRWTGFEGNTAWDWLKLLLLPVLVPTVVLPMVNQRIIDRLGGGQQHPAE
jgi:hypothetical protein